MGRRRSHGNLWEDEGARRQVNNTDLVGKNQAESLKTSIQQSCRCCGANVLWLQPGRASLRAPAARHGSRSEASRAANTPGSVHPLCRLCLRPGAFCQKIPLLPCPVLPVLWLSWKYQLRKCLSWGKSTEMGSLLRNGWMLVASFCIGCQQPTPSYPKWTHSCFLKAGRCSVPSEGEDFRKHCKWRQPFSWTTKVYQQHPRHGRCCHILGQSPHMALKKKKKKEKKDT